MVGRKQQCANRLHQGYSPLPGVLLESPKLTPISFNVRIMAKDGPPRSGQRGMEQNNYFRLFSTRPDIFVQISYIELAFRGFYAFCASIKQ